MRGSPESPERAHYPQLPPLDRWRLQEPRGLGTGTSSPLATPDHHHSSVSSVITHGAPPLPPYC